MEKDWYVEFDFLGFLELIFLQGTSALAGSVLGYLGSFWYPLLERMAPGKSPRAILKKLAIESALGLVLGAGVFLLVGAIQGKVWEDNVKAVKVNVPYLMATEVFFYLPAQWINFKYVPIAFRMLYVEVVQLVYDCIFIYLLYKVSGEVKIMLKSSFLNYDLFCRKKSTKGLRRTRSKRTRSKLKNKSVK